MSEPIRRRPEHLEEQYRARRASAPAPAPQVRAPSSSSALTIFGVLALALVGFLAWSSEATKAQAERDAREFEKHFPGQTRAEVEALIRLREAAMTPEQKEIKRRYWEIYEAAKDLERARGGS